MKKIMILGASILQLPAIKKAKEMGLEVVVVDMNPDAVGFQQMFQFLYFTKYLLKKNIWKQ